MRTCGPGAGSEQRQGVVELGATRVAERALDPRGDGGGACPDVVDRRALELERLPGPRELTELEQELRLVVGGDSDPDRLPVAVEAGQRRIQPLQRLAVAADHGAVERDIGLDHRAFGPVGDAELGLQRQRALGQGERLGHAA